MRHMRLYALALYLPEQAFGSEYYPNLGCSTGHSFYARQGVEERGRTDLTWWGPKSQGKFPSLVLNKP